MRRQQQRINFYLMNNRVFDFGLKAIPFYVYSYLVSCAGSRRSCFPAVRTIAAKCQCSESSVRAAIKELNRLGLVRTEAVYRENRYGIRQQTSNTYHIPPLPAYYENGMPKYELKDELPF